MQFFEQRAEIAKFMTRLYNKNLTTSSGGNISLFLNEKTVLITPSAKDKASLNPEDIGILTIEGENLTPENKLSMETMMHLEIYRKRPNIKAIIHAHPVFATSFSFSKDVEINTALTGETYAFTKIPVFAKYETMGSVELAKSVSDATLKGDCVVLEHHGILTVGNSLIDAFHKMELMESSAKMTLIAKFLGTNNALSQENLTKIDELLKKL